MQMAREPSKIKFEAKAALECGAITRQGCLEDGARGVVALHQAGVHVHPVDNVAFSEGDGVAFFQGGKRDGCVANLPYEPVSDVRERINPEEFRTAIAEQRNFDRKTFHGRSRMPGKGKETGQGFTRVLHCRRHDGVVECEIIKSPILEVCSIRLWRRRESGCARGIEYFRKTFCGFL